MLEGFEFRVQHQRTKQIHNLASWSIGVYIPTYIQTDRHTYIHIYICMYEYIIYLYHLGVIFFAFGFWPEVVFSCMSLLGSVRVGLKISCMPKVFFFRAPDSRTMRGSSSRNEPMTMECPNQTKHNAPACNAVV